MVPREDYTRKIDLLKVTNHIWLKLPKQKITRDWGSIRSKHHVYALLLFFLTLLETAYQARKTFVLIKHNHTYIFLSQQISLNILNFVITARTEPLSLCNTHDLVTETQVADITVRFLVTNN